MESQTSAIEAQSQAILDEQRRLQGLADDIDEGLRHYGYLEPVTRKLNAPGAGRLVRDKEFSETLSNLDRCISYMEAHVCHLPPSSFGKILIVSVSRIITSPPRTDPDIGFS